MLFFWQNRGSVWQSCLCALCLKNNILAVIRGVLAETRGVLAVCILFLAVFGSVWQSAGKNKKEITLSLLIGYWHFLTFYFNQTAKFLIFSISGTFSFCSDAPKCDIVPFYFFMPPAGTARAGDGFEHLYAPGCGPARTQTGVPTAGASPTLSAVSVIIMVRTGRHLLYWRCCRQYPALCR